MKSLCFLACTLALASFAAADTPRGILSNVAGSTTNRIPGYAGQLFWSNASAFGRIHASPNGNNFIFAGAVGESPTRRALIAGETDSPSTWTTPLFEGQAWPLGGGLLTGSTKTTAGIDDLGFIVCSTTSNEASSANDYILRISGTTYDVVAKEGQVAPGQTFTFQTVMGAAHIGGNGEAIFQSGGNSSTANGGLWIDETLISQRGVSVPQGQFNGASDVVTRYGNENYRVSPDLSVAMFQGRVGTNTAQDDVVVVNDVVVCQEGFALGLAPAAGLVTAQNTVALGGACVANGGYYTFRGTWDTTQDFAVFGNTEERSFDFIRRTGDPITVGSSIQWDDLGAFSGQGIAVSAVNQFGDTLVGGWTNDTDEARDFKLVLNDRYVILQENDPIDLDRNGLLDDDCFVNQVVADNVVLCSNNRVYAGATLRNSLGTVTGIGVIEFFAPLPGDIDGDGEVGPGDFSALATAFLSADGDPNWNPDADLDGDGEVGPGDFSILARNFLRSR